MFLVVNAIASVETMAVGQGLLMTPTWTTFALNLLHRAIRLCDQLLVILSSGDELVVLARCSPGPTEHWTVLEWNCHLPSGTLKGLRRRNHRSRAEEGVPARRDGIEAAFVSAG